MHYYATRQLIKTALKQFLSGLENLFAGKGYATTSAAGLMSATDKAKLDGIAAGAEVNQNAFARVAVLDMTIQPTAKDDYLTILPGNNVTITPDAANKRITIAATDTNTTYAISAPTTGDNANKLVLTPSSGSAQVVTVAYATAAGGANSAGSADVAGLLATNGTAISKGSATNPVYFDGGVPKACTYSLNKTVPSDAVFTDTTYSSKAAASGGTAVSLCTTGEKYTWNSKGTYSKPSGGIPKTDLASAVQTSLGKADSALQSQTWRGIEVSGQTVIASSSSDAVNFMGGGLVDVSYDTANGVMITGPTKVTSVSSSSTDNQVPTAKCLYDLVGDIESALAALR